MGLSLPDEFLMALSEGDFSENAWPVATQQCVGSAKIGMQLYVYIASMPNPIDPDL
jgi:hypothetical protein